ncbi:TerB family tellurite resistance protein [Nocardia sp. alder85J]|uniref:TerB family tellurite resistance protein n=1 Tax=Nocardia sp. alder85J TaxID=2862949 RepID=UPI001CD7C978|nr:TerB family tellurite resistance protein [Nocardia sp. alder85J]MCX4095117.1 TerB family tellurite resistance protein [Nocardia sp. alder85J]
MLRGNSFRDAVVGVCALVSSADAVGDPDQRSRVADRIGTAPVLHHFPPRELRNMFEDNWHRLILDPAFGRAYVFQEVAKATAEPVAARAAVRAGLEIAAPDGDVGVRGVAALRECCAVLRLTPAEFGL